jgi:hypothetical protein
VGCGLCRSTEKEGGGLEDLANWVVAQQGRRFFLLSKHLHSYLTYDSNLNPTQLRCKINPIKLQGSHTSKLYFLNFIVLIKINLSFSGEDHRRHPYILIMHWISNRNFEIHIFASLTFRRKFQDVTEHPLQKNLVLEIEASLVHWSTEHLQVVCELRASSASL